MKDGRTKLDALQVATVRDLAKRGVSYQSIAVQFGIGKTQVCRIVNLQQRMVNLRSLLRMCC